MFLRKIRTSITKLILPSLHLILKLLKANTRTVNFLNDKKTNANNSYNFQTNIEKLLKNKKLIGLDVGAQGGFNSDKFFPERYNKYFIVFLLLSILLTRQYFGDCLFLMANAMTPLHIF